MTGRRRVPCRYNLAKSRKHVLIAWMLSFFAPFLISVIPMASFTDWTVFEEVTELYLNMFEGTF
jgi:hypothetical protein